LRASRRLTGGLHSGEQHADQHGDDRDHDEKLDEGETPGGRGANTGDPLAGLPW
jgi:hypothetical protein